MEGFEGGRRAVGGSWCEDDEAMESLPGRQHRLPLRSDRPWHLPMMHDLATNRCTYRLPPSSQILYRMLVYTLSTRALTTY